MTVVYRKHPLTAGRLVDGLAFVVTAENNKLHTLNQTASHLWALCDEGLNIEDAAVALSETFEIDVETARADARECLDNLVGRDILTAGE